MIIDAQYNLHLILVIGEDIYIEMGEKAGDGVVVSDNERVYEKDSMMTLEIIFDAYRRAGYNIAVFNIVSAKNPNHQSTWWLAHSMALTREDMRQIILEFEDTRNNRNRTEWDF